MVYQADEFFALIYKFMEALVPP